MEFSSPLIRGALISRYKRFLADVRLGDGRIVTAACPNTGTMSGLTATLSGYDNIRREVRYGANSRIDLLLEKVGGPPCYVEVKNVTLYRRPKLAEFPDCVTERGTKHLAELSSMVAAGKRAMMVYCIQGGGAEAFALTPDIDPRYHAAYLAARARGVDAIALTCHVGLDGISVTGTVPILE